MKSFEKGGVWVLRRGGATTGHRAEIVCYAWEEGGNGGAPRERREKLVFLFFRERKCEKNGKKNNICLLYYCNRFGSPVNRSRLEPNRFFLSLILFLLMISFLAVVTPPACSLHLPISLKNSLFTCLILVIFMHFCSNYFFHIIFVLLYSLLVDLIFITCILIQIIFFISCFVYLIHLMTICSSHAS